MTVVSLKKFIQIHWDQIALTLISSIAVITYFESFRWPLPGLKATHGIAKGLSLVLATLLIFGWRKQAKQLQTPRNALMLIFFISYLISTIFSLDLPTSLLNLWYPFMATVIFLSLSVIPLKKEYFSLVTVFSVLLIFITFVFSFFSIIFRYSVDNLYYYIFLDDRANQLLSEIRQYGKYVSLGPYFMLAPLALIPLVEKVSIGTRKILSFFILLVTLLTAVISNNRIDVLVFAVQYAVYLFVLTKKQVIAFVLPALALVWFGLFMTQTYFGFNLEQRILQPAVERDQETVSMRFTYWQTALNNFRNFPLFGTGPNTYNVVSDFPLRKYYSQGTSQYTFKLDRGIGVHNLFIERLADTGLFGFVSFVALLWFFGREDVLALVSLRQLKDKEGFKKYLLYALGSWSWILFGITDNGYGAQGFMVFFFVRGLLPHVYRLEHVKK